MHCPGIDSMSAMFDSLKPFVCVPAKVVIQSGRLSSAGLTPMLGKLCTELVPPSSPSSKTTQVSQVLASIP